MFFAVLFSPELAWHPPLLEEYGDVPADVAIREADLVLPSILAHLLSTSIIKPGDGLIIGDSLAILDETGANNHYRVRNSGTRNSVPINVFAGTLDNVPRN